MSSSESDSYNILGPTHNLHVEIATALKSADLALFLNHISYWVHYNRRMGRNFHEGRFWTYQTLKELHAHFPYWTEKQLRLIKEKLIKIGILIKGNFNQSKYDQTIWYTIDYEKVKSICPNGQLGNTETATGNSQTGKPIPDNKPNNKPNNICADKIDAFVPKKSIERIARRDNVHTSEEEHLKLIKKVGSPEFLEKCYDHLSEWKKSISENDKKAAEKHTDYYRIPKWVVKSIKESEILKVPIIGGSSNRDKVMCKYRHGQLYNGAECFINDDSIAFQRGMTHLNVRFKELGFEEQFANMKRKFGIP